MSEPTYEGDARSFELLDGKRTIVFEGWQIGEASSRTDASDRWIDMTLYVTAGGTYVLSKIGCSDVFHGGNCKRPSKGKRHETLVAVDPDGAAEYALEELFVPCRECRPAYDVSPVWAETDMPSVQTFRSVDDLFDALHQKKGGNVRSLSRVSRALLDEAREVDPEISRVLATPVQVQ